VTWPDLKTAPHDKRSICRLVECTTTRPLPPLKLDAGVRIMLVVSQPVDAPTVEWIETQRMLETQIKANKPAIGAERMQFWLKLLDALVEAGAVTRSKAIDSTYVKAQRAAFGAKGGARPMRSVGHAAAGRPSLS
jgi:hypothetical protein